LSLLTITLFWSWTSSQLIPMLNLNAKQKSDYTFLMLKTSESIHSNYARMNLSSLIYLQTTIASGL
jgi:hypothetical protein